jgi:hypothetical protein
MAKRVPRNIEFCVVSAGGVATTQLLAYFQGRYAANSLCDADSLKHLPIPAVSFNPFFRCVYLFGDPVPAVISLFRRGYHALQARKLRRGCGGSSMESCLRIEEYATGGRDLFGFEAHFDNYFQRHLVHPTLFIRYESLWDHLPTLRAFLHLEKSAFDDFAPRRSRHEADVPPAVVDQLRAIYRPFQKRLDDMPDTFVRGGHLAQRRRHLLFSANLRLAALNAFKARLRPAHALYGE